VSAGRFWHLRSFDDDPSTRGISRIDPPIVALDVAPFRAQPTGVGVYVRDLVAGLATIAPYHLELIGVRPSGGLAERYPWMVRGRLDDRSTHLAWLQTRADRHSRRHRAAIAHWSNAMAPLRARLPYVLTIQDLSLFRYPGFHPPARLATAPVVLASAHRADVILVPSQATRREVVRLLRVPAGRIVVVPHAPGGTVGTVAPEEVVRTRQRFGLTDPYLL
jgi:alpha-1,3-rhamnosyl/mannosyltransferase